MRTYSRDDIQTHSDHFAPGRPAVNVKIYGTIEQAWAQFEREERADEDIDFTLEWIEQHLSEQALQDYWDAACESEFEYLEQWATSTEQGDSLFPDDNVKLWQEGRSGGWIVVDGLPDIEEWDAVRIARWRKFERIARDIASGIPYQVLSLIYLNAYEWEKSEQEERERAARHDIATVAS